MDKVELAKDLVRAYEALAREKKQIGFNRSQANIDFLKKEIKQILEKLRE